MRRSVISNPIFHNLMDRLIGGLLGKIPDCFLTRHPEKRLPGHASFYFKFIEGESILLHLDFLEIGATSGSTCSSGALKGSHVLEGIGVDRTRGQGSVDFSLAIDNSLEEVESLLRELPIRGKIEKSAASGKPAGAANPAAAFRLQRTPAIRAGLHSPVQGRFLLTER